MGLHLSGSILDGKPNPAVVAFIETIKKIEAIVNVPRCEEASSPEGALSLEATVPGIPQGLG